MYLFCLYSLEFPSSSALVQPHSQSLKTMQQTFYLVIFFFSFLLIFRYFYRQWAKSKGKSSRRRKNFAPCTYPLIGNLMSFVKNRHRFFDWATDLISSVPSQTIEVRSPFPAAPGICTANPSNIEHLLKTNFSNYVKGSRFHDVLYELLGEGIFNVDGHLWFNQRKIASHEFNTKSLKFFISNIVGSEIESRLIPFLSSVSDRGDVIDLQDVLRRFSFDNICNLAFGIDPACLEAHANTSSNSIAFAKAFDEAMDISFSRFLTPLQIFWKIKRFFNIGSERRLRRAIQIVDEFAYDIIRKRDEEMKAKADINRYDLLSRFVDAAEDLGLSDENQKKKFLRDIVISFVLAGKDSTSVALTWFFLLLSKNPNCERKIYDEITTCTSNTIKDGDNFLYEDLKEMHYLHASVTEALRLYPPVPINSRLVKSEDTLPDGTFVGAGWFADYSSYAVGRMKEIWGDDCEEFKPERWLVNGVFVPTDAFRFPVFHAGPRTCLGKDMAYLQMKAVVASVLREFELVIVDSSSSCYQLSLTLKMKEGLKVRIKKRRNMNL